MRNALAVIVAAVLWGAVPAGAQMRRAPVTISRARPMRLPNRAFTYSGPHQVRPAVRVVYVNPSATGSRPTQTAVDSNPSLPDGSSFTTPTTASTSLAYSGSGGTPIPLGQILNPVPGLGFDYNYLAAINSGLAVRAFIDPVTEHELAIDEQLPQEQPIGFFPFYDEQAPVVTGSSEPEVIVVQQPAPAAQAAPAPAAAAPTTPPLPVGSLYLVQRDGITIKAIAFTEQNGAIVYITSDGVRHSMGLDALDIPATEQRNAERGTILHLTE